MNKRRFPSQPDEVLRRLGGQVVPVDEPERVEQRREQVVGALSRAIRESAERRRRALRARLGLSLALAASLALGVGAAVHAHRTVELTLSRTTVADISGAVVVTEAGQSRVVAHGSVLSLQAGGEIETALDARAELRSEKSVLRVAPATKLTVPAATRLEERYRLALGRVDVSVDKDSRLSRSVVVETPNAEVVVHGTVFAVGVASRSDRTVTDVSVTRGSVWVMANGVQVALLGPGQHWTSETPAGSAHGVSDVASEVKDASSHVDRVPLRERIHVARSRDATAEAKASALADESRMFQDGIDARNRGDDARAVELFSQLLARYPSYEEAEVQLFRAQKRLGRAASAAAQARRYLAQHPQGFAHDEARTLALSSPSAPSD